MRIRVRAKFNKLSLNPEPSTLNPLSNKYLYNVLRKLFLLLVLTQGISTYAQLDSLLDKLKTAKEDTNKALILCQLSELCGENDIMKYASEALTLSEKLNYPRGMAGALGNMGYAYGIIGDMAGSLDCFKRSERLLEQIGAKQEVATAYNNIGFIYSKLGDNAQALDYFDKSLKMNMEFGNHVGMAAAYNNIGLIYSAQGNHAKELEHYLKSLKESEATGDVVSAGYALKNISQSYLEQGFAPEAAQACHRSIKMLQQAGDERGLGYAYSQLALINSRLGRDAEALQYYEKGRVLLDSAHSKEGLQNLYMSQGDFYFKRKQYKEAEENALRSMQLAKELGYPGSIKLNSYLLSSIYSAQGRYKEAFDMHVLFKQMADSVSNVASHRAAANFEFLKKDAERQALQDKKDALQEKEQQQQRLISYALSAGLVLVLLLALFIYRGYRQKQQANKIISEQKAVVEEKQKEILDSIHYAKRIQGALLASESLLNEHLPEHFVLYKPKDIVSGDFYWATPINPSTSSGQAHQPSTIILCVADCTGHGVPGAFMSLLNISLLNEAILEKKISKTNEVFDRLRSSIITVLNPQGEQESKDGMDGILCSFDLKNLVMEYTAANNSFYIVRGRELITCAADKMPVGRSPREQEPFTLHKVPLQKGDIIYTLTDGYADQFGGPKGKKFKYKQLEELFLSIAAKPMEEQRSVLDSVFNDWKGELEQVDDVLVIGVRV